jgi:mono/diheme cytochrome c family protein
MLFISPMMRLARPILLLLGVVASGITLSLACAAPPPSLAGDPVDLEAKSKKAGAQGGVVKDGLPCDVVNVLTKNCQTCHGPETTSGASTSLVTWDDLQKDRGGKKVYELVKDRVLATTGRMPPATHLTDAETKALTSWIDGGAKKATASCDTGQGPPPSTKPFVCNAPGKVTTVKPPHPFTWQDNGQNDHYLCYGVEETPGTKQHVIAMGPQIDNLAIVHHVILFQADEAVSPEPYECKALGGARWKMVTGWAPGGGNFELPPEAGFPVDGTTHWAVQMHYNNAKNLPGQVDNSGYQLCETDQLRPNDAGILAFGVRKFEIPPRTASYTMRCDYKLTSRYAPGVTFFSAVPHMHLRGVRLGTELLRGGTGAPETVFAQNPFNFENQANFPIPPKQATEGDVMRTRCTWKNPDDHTVTWGENTDDEMCFNFLSYYPAIPDVKIGPIPVQSWITPTAELPAILGGPDCSEE